MSVEVVEDEEEALEPDSVFVSTARAKLPRNRVSEARRSMVRHGYTCPYALNAVDHFSLEETPRALRGRTVEIGDRTVDLDDKKAVANANYEFFMAKNKKKGGTAHYLDNQFINSSAERHF